LIYQPELQFRAGLAMTRETGARSKVNENFEKKIDPPKAEQKG
jgi:hypothetical protein